MKFSTPTKQDLFLLAFAFLCDAGIFVLIAVKVGQPRPYDIGILAMIFRMISGRISEFSPSLVTFILQLPVALFALSLAFLISGLVKADVDEITFTHIHIKKFLSLTALIPSMLLFLMVILRL
jgi:hypothetical protein